MFFKYCIVIFVFKMFMRATCLLTYGYLVQPSKNKGFTYLLTWQLGSSLSSEKYLKTEV